MITPGHYLSEWLKNNDITINKASEEFGIDDKTMRKLLEDEISFRGYSTRAEKLTSIPREHWLKLQEEHEKDKNDN